MGKMDTQLPDEVLALSDQELLQRIRDIKSRYQKEMIILGHHYQRHEIIEVSDYRGDSLELSRIASQQKEARYIVFCGVNFMAESAAILAQPHQQVIHPDSAAGCPLADFAQIDDVERCWAWLDDAGLSHDTLPLTYVNSSAEIKAFCGRHEGVCCTSANAQKVLKWALGRKKRVLFMPDENLGRNTARRLGIPQSRIAVWDPTLPSEYADPSLIKASNVLVWRGYCHVHTFFTPDDVMRWREKISDAKIIVHPECTQEVVELSDASGSTGQIIKYVDEQPPGTTIIIGTEINMVQRLAKETKDKKIYPLSRSLCPNMFKINLPKLYHAIKNPGQVNVVTIPESIKNEAALSLSKMLEIS